MTTTEQVKARLLAVAAHSGASSAVMDQVVHRARAAAAKAATTGDACQNMAFLDPAINHATKNLLAGKDLTAARTGLRVALVSALCTGTAPRSNEQIVAQLQRMGSRVEQGVPLKVDAAKNLATFKFQVDDTTEQQVRIPVPSAPLPSEQHSARLRVHSDGRVTFAGRGAWVREVLVVKRAAAMPQRGQGWVNAEFQDAAGTSYGRLAIKVAQSPENLVGRQAAVFVSPAKKAMAFVRLQPGPRQTLATAAAPKTTVSATAAAATATPAAHAKAVTLEMKDDDDVGYDDVDDEQEVEATLDAEDQNEDDWDDDDADYGEGDYGEGDDWDGDWEEEEGEEDDEDHPSSLTSRTFITDEEYDLMTTQTMAPVLHSDPAVSTTPSMEVRDNATGMQAVTAPPGMSLNLTLRNENENESDNQVGGPARGPLYLPGLTYPYIVPGTTVGTDAPVAEEAEDEDPAPVEQPYCPPAPACPSQEGLRCPEGIKQQGTFFCMNRRTFTVVIIMLLVASMLAGLGYWIYRKSKVGGPGGPPATPNPFDDLGLGGPELGLGGGGPPR
jgi:hypothetical protein